MDVGKGKERKESRWSQGGAWVSGLEQLDGEQSYLLKWVVQKQTDSSPTVCSFLPGDYPNAKSGESISHPLSSSGQCLTLNAAFSPGV